MKVMFFRTVMAYLSCSFITLMMFITGRLKIGSLKLNKKKVDNSIVIVAFSYYWPFTLWLTYKTLKNNLDKED